MNGVEEIVERHLAPLKAAFPDLARRDDIFMSGTWQGGDWISATGCYDGVPRSDWLGLKPKDAWISLRYGEFYKLGADGKIVDVYAMIDMVDLFRQLGVNPCRPGLGVEGLWPGPAAQDGLRLTPAPEAQTTASLDLVQAMIFQGMHGFDGVDHDTMHFERYFTETMMWYGPGGTGSTRGLDGFMRHHEIPFNEAWPDFKGGDHKARFADGPYVCSTGWPSIRATHTGGDWMGLAGSHGEALRDAGDGLVASRRNPVIRELGVHRRPSHILAVQTRPPERGPFYGDRYRPGAILVPRLLFALNPSRASTEFFRKSCLRQGTILVVLAGRLGGDQTPAPCPARARRPAPCEGDLPLSGGM